MMEARLVLQSIENLQNFENSAARQLFDLKIVSLFSKVFLDLIFSF